MLLAVPTTGWIGVDVGTSTVKVAQLERCDGYWKWRAAAVVPRRTPWPQLVGTEDPVESSRNELSAVKSLESRLRGRRAAAVLPMTVSDVHAINRAMDDDPRAPAMIRHWVEVATQQEIASCEVRHWPIPRNENGNGGDWTGAVTLLRPWGDQLCGDIAGLGWSCQVIDALPFAMTRAAAMVCEHVAGVPLAALDWGYHRATLSIATDGQPAYVRCLKNCGSSRVTEILVRELGICPEDATRLLLEHGLPSNTRSRVSDAALVVGELIAEPLEHLAGEIARSVEHFQYQRRTRGPEELILMGGGATLRGLPEYLEQQTGLGCRRWELGEPLPHVKGADPSSQCLFAVAAALSTLAWSRSSGKGHS